MATVPDLFTAHVPKGIGALVHPELGRIHFRSLSPARALELWAAGLPELRITAEGARQLLGKAKARELARLMERCTTLQEVEALAALSTSTTVRTAADKQTDILKARA